MIFSGANYRKLQEKKDYNFFLDSSITNTSGSAVFGFSGEGEKFAFNFVEGRVIDPSNNYVFSYDTGSLTISGTVNQGNYNYFINNERINFSGSKNNFLIDRFFVDCTGCNLSIDNLLINGSGQTTFSLQKMNQLIGDSGHFTGEIVTDDPSFGKFDIFSGEILTSTATGLFSILTDFSTGIEATGIIGVSGLQNIENQTPYSFDALLYTSFGEVQKTFNVTGSTPFFQPEINISQGNNNYQSGGSPKVNKYFNHVASNTLFTGDPTFATGLSLNVSLSYLEGFTGEITGALTGVNVLTSGENYSAFSLPDIVVSGNGQDAVLSGSVSGGGLTGINVVHGGSGYGSSPSILIYSGVTAVQVVSGVQGYFSSPVIEFSGGREGGHAASGEVNIAENGTISSISITNLGNRYTGVPSINILPGLSGVNLTHSGSGYASNPTVVLGEAGGSGAVVDAVTGDPSTIYSGFITGFNLVSGGSGYTGVPSVTVSGGSPLVSGSGEAVLSSGFVGAVSMYSGASATGLVGNYTKDFTGIFNLLTGSGDNFHNFREAGQITSDNLSYTGENVFFRQNSSLAIGVESEIDIQLVNYNYFDSLPLVAQLTVSGSGTQTTGLRVTGIK